MQSRYRIQSVTKLHNHTLHKRKYWIYLRICLLYHVAMKSAVCFRQFCMCTFSLLIIAVVISIQGFAHDDSVMQRGDPFIYQFHLQPIFDRRLGSRLPSQHLARGQKIHRNPYRLFRVLGWRLQEPSWSFWQQDIQVTLTPNSDAICIVSSLRCWQAWHATTTLICSVSLISRIASSSACSPMRKHSWR